MLIYRKLRPVDLPAYQRHLVALSPDERRLRFQGGVSDTSIIEHCSRIDWSRTVIIGAFDGGRLSAAAELRFERRFLPRTAEFAVSVETAHQGLGIGQELAQRAVTTARNRGIAMLDMQCLPENQKMQKIARHLGGTVALDVGSVEAHVALGVPTPYSFLSEALHDSSAAWLGWVERPAA